MRLLCLRGGANDSPQALKALELFLKVASPAATQIVDEFMASRTSVTVDEFLLDELHRPVRPGEDPGVFVNEWQAFASGAISKDRSNVARRAWKQWRAFGGDDDRAAALLAMPPGAVERRGDGGILAAMAQRLAMRAEVWLRACDAASVDARTRAARVAASAAATLLLAVTVVTPPDRRRGRRRRAR